MSKLPFPPGALSTRDAFDYVGGRGVFEALTARFTLKPFYVGRKVQVYRREDIDEALRNASAQATINDEPLTPNK